MTVDYGKCKKVLLIPSSTQMVVGSGYASLSPQLFIVIFEGKTHLSQL